MDKHRLRTLYFFGTIAVTLALLFAAKSYSAQRQVRGLVTLDGAPVENAVVKIENLNSLHVRSYITKKDGQYHFASLSTFVDYALWAEKKGRSSSREILSRFDTDNPAIINLSLE